MTQHIKEINELIEKKLAEVLKKIKIPCVLYLVRINEQVDYTDEINYDSDSICMTNINSKAHGELRTVVKRIVQQEAKTFTPFVLNNMQEKKKLKV